MSEFKVGYIYRLFYEAYDAMYEWVDGLVIEDGRLDNDSMNYLEYITLTRYGYSEITLEMIRDMELEENEMDELICIHLMREASINKDVDELDLTYVKTKEGHMDYNDFLEMVEYKYAEISYGDCEVDSALFNLIVGKIIDTIYVDYCRGERGTKRYTQRVDKRPFIEMEVFVEDDAVTINYIHSPKYA